MVCIGVLVVVSTVVAGLKILLEYRAFAQRTFCVGNQVRLRLAKTIVAQDLGLKDGDIISLAAVQKEWAETKACPNGGSYILGPVGAWPKCTYANLSYTYRFDRKKMKVERRAWTHPWGGPRLKPNSADTGFGGEGEAI